MAFSMLLLFVVGALGPFLVHELHLTRSELGALVAAAFGVATLLSLVSGQVVDLVGGRTALVWLLGLVALNLVVLSIAPTFAALLAAAALGGVAQSLANPATNKLVAGSFTRTRRAMVLGVKQSGVQVGAFAAGLLLAPLAAASGWRTALRLAALVPAAAIVLAVAVAPAAAPADGPRLLRAPRPPSALARWLMAYSLFLGAGIAAVNTYLP